MEEAVRMLGLSAIRTLVISANLTGTFQKVPHVNLPSFWRHSLRVASVARHLAGQGRSVDPNLAFTVGSMYAIGHLIMAIVKPVEIASVNTSAAFDSMRRFDVEVQAFGYHYGDVSARLAARWDFSEEYVTALSGFARPLDMASFDPLAGLLHLGVWRMALDRESAAASGAARPAEVLQALNLPPDSLEEMPAPEELAADLELMIG
jgi:HD-like signal output (HDOD) protein